MNTSSYQFYVRHSITDVSELFNNAAKILLSYIPDNSKIIQSNYAELQLNNFKHSIPKKMVDPGIFYSIVVDGKSYSVNQYCGPLGTEIQISIDYLK